MKTFLFLTTFTLFSSGCSLFSPSIQDVDILKKENWKNFKAKKMADKIVVRKNEETKEIIDALSSEYEVMLEYLNEDDYDIDNTYVLPRLQKPELLEAFKSLPRAFQNFLNSKIKAVVLTTRMKMPLIVYPMENKGEYLMLLDININSFDLNQWYKWREVTAFDNLDSKLDFSPLLSNTNHKTETAQFLWSQAIAILLSWNPEVFPKKLAKAELKKYPFLNQSWIRDEGILKSRFDEHLGDIAYLSHYRKSAQDISRGEIFNIYQRIRQTNFISLYAAANPLKDFIESMSLFIYSEVLKKPFSIEFYQDGVLFDTFVNCFNTDRCSQKGRELAKILKTHIK